MGAPVVRVDPVARSIALAGRPSLGYERCLVASGARPLAPPVPGAGLPGVHLLRSLEDARVLRRAARGARRAVVVGGGLIGVEVAAALSARGIRCTLLAREPWILGHIAPEPVGRAIERVLSGGGVTLVMGSTVAAIERPAGGGGRLVIRTTHGRTFEGDVVAAGVGVAPCADFLSGTGLLSPDGGVAVDDRLRSAAPGLYAAGDVAAYADPVLGVRHRVEHWLHAQHQGRRAGDNMAGGDAPYRRVTSYDTTLFGAPVMAFGAPALAEEWVESEGVAWGMRAGCAVAAWRVGGAGDPAVVLRKIESQTAFDGA